MAKVIKPFKDKTDDLRIYKVDETYKGDRLEELYQKGYLDLTVAEIKSILEAKKVEFAAKAKKEDLLALLK